MMDGDDFPVFPRPDASDVEPDVCIVGNYWYDVHPRTADADVLYDNFFCHPVASDVRVEGRRITIKPRRRLGLRTSHTLRLVVAPATENVWGAESDTELSFTTRDGRWGPPIDLGEGGPGRHSVDADGDGTVVVGWVAGDSINTPYVLCHTGGWTPCTAMTTPRTDGWLVRDLAVIAAPEGAYAAWSEFDTNSYLTKGAVFLAAVSADRQSSPPALVTDYPICGYALMRTWASEPWLIWEENQRGKGLWCGDPRAFDRTLARRVNDDDGRSIYGFRATSDSGFALF